MTSDNVVELRGVSMIYNRRTVLDIPEFHVPVGARLLVTGANGSGKSTLLRLLAGITVPTRGRVLWHLRSRRVAFVPQSGGYLDELSVADNARLIARTLGGWARCLLDRPDLLESFGLLGDLDRRVGTLSEGTRRLLVLLAAISGAPDLLVADEPFSGIDEANQQKLETLLATSLEDRAAYVASTHSSANEKNTIRILHSRIQQ